VKTDLKELIEFASSNAETIFRKQDEFLPMWHAVSGDGDALVIVAPDFTDDKDTGIAMVKKAFELNNVECYVFVSEAWVLETKDPRADATIKKAMREGLANHPDRREVISFIAENNDGEMRTAHRYILRPEIGKPKLSPLVLNEAFDQASGRMTGLLKQRDKK